MKEYYVINLIGVILSAPFYILGLIIGNFGWFINSIFCHFTDERAKKVILD